MRKIGILPRKRQTKRTTELPKIHYIGEKSPVNQFTKILDQPRRLHALLRTNFFKIFAETQPTKVKKFWQKIFCTNSPRIID